MAKDFECYAIGPISASVCTSLPLNETTVRLNEEYPTGIDSPWRKSKDETFASGQPNPTPCENNPKTHRHYLFNC